MGANYLEACSSFYKDDIPPDDALNSVSLVSKTFLFITNRLKQTLRPQDGWTVDTCRALFARFPNLVRLAAVYAYPVNWVLRELACFQLPLIILVLNCYDRLPRDILSVLPMATRSTLRSLGLMEFNHLTEDDMSAIGDLFPNLEKLNVTNPTFPWRYAETCLTDEGIDRLACKIHGLRRINLKGNQRVTDKSVISLRENCPNIEDINVLGCPHVTHDVKILAKKPKWGRMWMVVDCHWCSGDGCCVCGADDSYLDDSDTSDNTYMYDDQSSVDSDTSENTYMYGDLDSDSHHSTSDVGD